MTLKKLLQPLVQTWFYADVLVATRAIGGVGQVEVLCLGQLGAGTADGLNPNVASYTHRLGQILEEKVTMF